MSRWVEIGVRPRRRHADVVTVSNAVRQGVTLSLRPAALEALGTRIGGKVRVAVDADPAAPRLRLVADSDGPFTLSRPPNGTGDIAMLRLGHQPDIADTGRRVPVAPVTWEAMGGGVIVLDLPTGLRAAATTTVVRDRGPPSSSRSTPKQAITLPRVRALEAEDEPPPDRRRRA